MNRPLKNDGSGVFLGASDGIVNPSEREKDETGRLTAHCTGFVPNVYCGRGSQNGFPTIGVALANFCQMYTFRAP
jgi:hypothetical protein